MLKVQSDIVMNMDKQHVYLLIMLDLSATFNNVDYGILFKILENDFGLPGNVLKWVDSYLSERQQQILINNTYSVTANLFCGVPHGSCLSPVLFLRHKIIIRCKYVMQTNDCKWPVKHNLGTSRNQEYLCGSK